MPGDSAGVGSGAWRQDLARRLADAGPVTGRRLALGQVVTGPGEARAWTIVVGGGEASAVLEGTASAQVCLVGDEDVADRLAAGTSPAPLLAEGRLKVRGDATALVEGQETLASLAEALRALPGA